MLADLFREKKIKPAKFCEYDHSPEIEGLKSLEGFASEVKS